MSENNVAAIPHNNFNRGYDVDRNKAFKKIYYEMANGELRIAIAPIDADMKSQGVKCKICSRCELENWYDPMKIDPKSRMMLPNEGPKECLRCRNEEFKTILL